MIFDNRPKSSFFKTLLISLFTSLTVGFAFIMLYSGLAASDLRNLSQSPDAGSEGATQVPQRLSAETGEPGGYKDNSISSVAKSATPGVVGISVLKVDGSNIFDRNAAEKWGFGSGVIVTNNGFILTNYHVAGAPSKRIIVTLSDGRNIDGFVVWGDPILDLAVVKINANNLTAIPLGDATSVQVGDTAIAIGNPLGLQFQRTVTSGIISALNRTIKIDTDEGANYMEDLIQTDASINPGNSGGPLLNLKGEVVGINTIKVTSAEGIGFAIPINIAVPVIKQLTESGQFLEPYMGIFAYDKEVIPYLDGNIKLDKGIYVANIDDRGPAYKAGIRLGCIITQIDGVDINTMLQLRAYIYSKKPGDTINVNYIDKGNAKTVSVVLERKSKNGTITR